ncbi:sulfurtransferase [Candidatus Nitrosotalea okcheonensis]|uniref:Rhodanese-related sulfurtransferase n=1 Tax=Candidatus Nitrosotalea okcheonensis TaxID=1903276 RepID=A0A2H1FIH7_9ARCH|nr:sulfurtransferase [Candidatus Nitrosotalea okcheonensis]SMH72569.1 Rhodanese-related sulfurtransferase [Candidatus Nitrosotalea okcheonensis]
MSSHQWLAEHYNDPDLVILDSRGNVPYSYAHIPNSQPLGIEKVVQTNQYGANIVIENDQAATLFGSLGIDESKTVIIYGDYLDPSAARIAWTFLYFGHEKTKILDIGMTTWQKKGLPITRDIPKPTGATFIPKINSLIRIEAEELYKKLDTVITIDTRSLQEFMAGRIPYSILFPFTDGVGDDGSLFKDKDELLRIFNEQQIPKDKELVCYCALGHRAANVFTQLRLAGYENVKLYDGSFADWVGRRLTLG